MDKLNEIKRKYDILEAEVEKITERIKGLPVCKLTGKAGIPGNILDKLSVIDREMKDVIDWYDDNLKLLQKYHNDTILIDISMTYISNLVTDLDSVEKQLSTREA